MPIYTVHTPRTSHDPVDSADRTTFVREGFNGWAFLFGPLFLLRHRAWLAGALWLLLLAGGAAIAAWLQVPSGARIALLVVAELFLGLEADTIRRRTLDRRGYAFAGLVAGARREDSELSFFRAQTLAPPATAARRPAGTAVFQPASDPVIGLFPQQGG